MGLPDLSVIDVETTGFAYKSTDRIVEIGIVRTDSRGNKIDEFETLVNPERDVGPTEIHGVTAEMVKEAPKFNEIYEVILEFLNESLLVAHNATFDVNFLRYELDRVGESVQEPSYLCTLQASRQVFSDYSSHKLTKLCNYLDIELEQAHSALADARATQELLNEIRQTDPEIVSLDVDAFAVDKEISR